MEKFLSFTKIENELLPKFRKQINEAESTEDVKKFFSYSIRELLGQVFSGQIEVRVDAAALIPDKEPPFEINEKIRANEAFISVWNTSDLSNIVTRFSQTAMNHYVHLKKNLEKTEAKIRK